MRPLDRLFARNGVAVAASSSRRNDGAQITAAGLAMMGLDGFVSLDSTDTRVVSQAVLIKLDGPRR